MKKERFRLSEEQSWTAYGFGLLAAVLFFSLGVMSLSEVGFTWDSSENLLTGQHYVRFFQTGDEQWLDFDQWNEIYLNAGSEQPLLYNRAFNAPFR
mgnify:CR=1 FL=1